MKGPKYSYLRDTGQGISSGILNFKVKSKGNVTQRNIKLPKNEEKKVNITAFNSRS